MVIIKYVRWGLAERIGSTIYLNENLKQPFWSDLHDHLLNHELGHEEVSKSTLKDIVHDLKDSTRNFLPTEIFFMTQHPRAWVQVLGVSIREGNIAVDWTNILINLFVISFITLCTWFVINWV